MIFMLIVFIMLFFFGSMFIVGKERDVKPVRRSSMFITALIYAVIVGGFIAFLFGQIVGIPPKWKTEKKVIIPFEHVPESMTIKNLDLKKYAQKKTFTTKNEKTLFVYDEEKLYFLCRTPDGVEKVVIESSPKIKIKRSSKNYSYLLIKTPVFHIGFWKINFGNDDYHEHIIYINQEESIP